MSVDILGTSWDQCRSMVQYSFTSMETRRLVRTDSLQDGHLDSHAAPELWVLRMYPWWSLCTLYLLACQVRVTVGDSDLCYVCVTSFGRWLTSLFVHSPQEVWALLRFTLKTGFTGDCMRLKTSFTSDGKRLKTGFTGDCMRLKTSFTGDGKRSVSYTHLTLPTNHRV